MADVDRHRDALTANGGKPGPCGWCKDRSGLSWQVVPRRPMKLLYGEDTGAAERAAQAMFQMGKIDIAALERLRPPGRQPDVRSRERHVDL